jgi:hypothetical protein
MQVEIKGYVKLVEHQFKAHMKYNARIEDMVNPNGKHL